MGKTHKSILPAAIGPLLFDHELEEITLQPGVYHLAKPITVGLSKKTAIIGLEYEPLPASAEEVSP
jgi:hypothetical protein